MIFLHRRHLLLQIPLQWVLIILFVVQTLGIIGLVGYLSYWSGQESIEKMSFQILEATEQRVSHELNRYLQSAHAFNQAQIAAVAAGTLDPNNLDQLHRYLNLQHRQTNDLTTLLFGTPQGDFRASHRVSPRDYGTNTLLRPDELPYEVSFSNPLQPATLYIHAVNTAGNPARLLERLEKIAVQDRPWYRQAVKTGRAGWTAPFQIGRTDVLALNAYVPLYNDAKQLLGVFAVNIKLEQLNHFLAGLKIGQSGEAFIVDRNGLLIAQSTSELPYVSSHARPGSNGIGKPGTLAFERQSPETSTNPTIRQSYQYLKQVFGNLTALQSTQQMSVLIQGERLFLTVSPYKDAYGLDWRVVVVMPASDFTGEIQRNIRITVFLSFLALGGAIVSSTILSKRIAKRFTALNQASQALAQGDFNQTLYTYSSIVEVQGLATSFNQVAVQLQQLFQRQVEAEASRQSHARFQKLATAVPGMIYSFTRSTNGRQWFEYVSSSSQDIMELQPEQILADVDAALRQICPDDRLAVFEKLDWSAATLELFVHTYRIMTPSGQTKWVEASCRPLQQPNGNITWYGILMDVSTRKHMEEELQSLNERLQTLASVDSLTQVANRHHMELHLQQEWEQCYRVQAPISLVLLDIDHFKLYNDQYGHPQGDACLKQVADILKRHVNRPGDLVSRYGGEEFLLILPQTDPPGATYLVEKIRHSLTQAQIPHTRSPTAEYITISMGVVVIINVANVTSPVAAIVETDKLLYKAKQTRNTYCFQVI